MINITSPNVFAPPALTIASLIILVTGDYIKTKVYCFQVCVSLYSCTFTCPINEAANYKLNIDVDPYLFYLNTFILDVLQYYQINAITYITS